MKIRGMKTAIEFAADLNKIIEEKNISMFDAIMLYIERNGIEPEAVASMIKQNAIIKSQLESECQGLNLLVKKEVESE